MFLDRHAGKPLDPAFEAFAAAWSGVLLRVAFLLVGDRGHAEDLLRTALLRTALKWCRTREHPEATCDGCWSTSPGTASGGPGGGWPNARWTPCPRRRRPTATTRTTWSTAS